ncbi:protein APCDD1-like [Oratosquilla oratoria]|uniref:protein APCDD1-like n=1 Tax=Oratosquilla oratoria TaxID=337810 RepID=UPI003F75FBD3
MVTRCCLEPEVCDNSTTAARLLSSRRNLSTRLTMWVLLGVLAALLTSSPTLASSFEDNLIHESFENFPACEDVLRAARQRPVRAPQPPDLKGTWVSTSCETRPGPRYVLRSYEFHRDRSFRLTLHVYRDPWCAHPSHTLTATGSHTHGIASWVTPGATEADYTLTKVLVTAHSHRDASDLASAINESCPGRVNKAWRPHKQYEVTSYQDSSSSSSPPAAALNDVTTWQDEDCSSTALASAWHELQLLRVEEEVKRPLTSRRKPRTRQGGEREKDFERNLGVDVVEDDLEDGPVRELFLGDLHTDASHAPLYRPTGFQQPLRNTRYMGSCAVCRTVARSSEKSPPHLHARPSLPLLLAGSWASSRCETRPYGMFLTRLLTFRPDTNEWEATLIFYQNPECGRPSFSLDAFGTYSVPPHAESEYDQDLLLKKLYLTPEDPNLADALNLYRGKGCGKPGSWKPGVRQDVTPTGGCVAVSLKVPSLEKEIFRIDVGPSGSLQLYTGQTPTTPHLHESAPRPTSWAPPLSQCRLAHPQVDNSLMPMVGARVAASSTSPIGSSLCSTLVRRLLLVLLVFVGRHLVL